MEDSGFSVPEENADRIASAYAYGGEPGKLAPKGPPTEQVLRPPGTCDGSGGMVGTIGDYFRFAQMLCNKG